MDESGSPVEAGSAPSTRDARAAKLSALLLALAGVGGEAAPAHASLIGYGGSLAITPHQASVQQGLQTVVDVGFTDVTSLVGSYDLTIDFDPTLLSFAGITFSPFLDGPDNSIQGFTPAPGSLEAFEVSLGSLSTQTGFGSLPLFELTFDTLAAGTSPLTFDTVANAGVTVGDDIGNPYTNFTITNSSIDITAPPPPPDQVPEPNVLALLAAACLALVGRRVLKPRERHAAS